MIHFRFCKLAVNCYVIRAILNDLTFEIKEGQLLDKILKCRELEDELEGWMNKCKDQEDEMDELVNKAR